jgi:hypothetical protein
MIAAFLRRSSEESSSSPLRTHLVDVRVVVTGAHDEQAERTSGTGGHGHVRQRALALERGAERSRVAALRQETDRFRHLHASRDHGERRNDPQDGKSAGELP